ncbi:MAG TPA: hypothetical protein VFK20_05995 [Vicinamibacterales bacterium]|nr:hypothetical protein [Vicinamibacterales bacterium]
MTEHADTSMTGGERQFHAGRIAVGIVVLAFGVMLLLERAGVLDVHSGALVAPFFLIALGLARMVDPRPGCGRRHRALRGAPLLLIGLWMLVSELHLWGLDYGTSWPLILIGMGVLMVTRELIGERARREK